MSNTGPSIRAVCRVVNQSSCGSGSICGLQPTGKALILTNAHVAGTTPGRRVKIDVESTGHTIQAKVILGAYSSRTSTDWAVLETLDPYSHVEPVKLSKKRPTGSHYTKGFPRCRPHAGTDIRTVEIGPYVWWWEPDAIGGQSGSGVWSDENHLQYGLLTWQWNNHGAGQHTAGIYEQARRRTIAGEPRRDGMVELHEFDFTDINRDDTDDPLVEDGFFAESSITDLPIWYEDTPEPPTEPPTTNALSIADWIEYCRDVEELHEKWRLKFESSSNNSNNDGPTFGL